MILWTAAYQTPPSMGPSRQEYWSGLPLPSPSLQYFQLTNLFIYIYIMNSEAFLGAHMVKNLPVIQETQVQYPGRVDPLEERMATHSSILAWRIPWTVGPGGL